MQFQISRKWAVLLLVGVSIFMSTLDSSIVNIALPHMMQDLSTDVATVQWVVLIYLMTVSSLLLTFGRLSDIQGKQRVYVTGFSIFTMGSLMCALSPGPGLLIFSRAVQGVGASMLMACSPALVVDAFPEKERGRALGLTGAAVAAGLSSGPVVGGLILEYFSWPVIFYLNVPIGAAAAIGGVVVLRGMGPPASDREPMDIIGCLLLIAGISGMVICLNRLPGWGWQSLKIQSFAGLSLVSFGAFYFNGKYSRSPLFDPALFRIRLFLWPVTASAILFAGLFIMVFLMPFYLTYPCGFSAAHTGMVMIVPFLFLLVVSPVSGMLYDRIGSRFLCLCGMGALTASLFSLSTLDPSMGVFSVLWRISLAGLGTALFVSPNNTAAMSSVPPARRGIASGSVATARNLGMVLGIALAGLVFSSVYGSCTGGSSLDTYTAAAQPFFMAAFDRAMQTGALLCLAGMGVTLARGKETIS